MAKDGAYRVLVVAGLHSYLDRARGGGLEFGLGLLGLDHHDRCSCLNGGAGGDEPLDYDDVFIYAELGDRYRNSFTQVRCVRVFPALRMRTLLPRRSLQNQPELVIVLGNVEGHNVDLTSPDPIGTRLARSATGSPDGPTRASVRSPFVVSRRQIQGHRGSQA